MTCDLDLRVVSVCLCISMLRRILPFTGVTAEDRRTVISLDKGTVDTQVPISAYGLPQHLRSDVIMICYGSVLQRNLFVQVQ
jgi:hypothetical protein